MDELKKLKKETTIQKKYFMKQIKKLTKDTNETN